jgi:hypothetical protein
MLIRFNNFTGYGEALVALMFIAYFFIFWLQNKFSMFPQIYGIYEPTFTTFAIWLQLFLVTMVTVIVEFGLKACARLGYTEYIFGK